MMGGKTKRSELCTDCRGWSVVGSSGVQWNDSFYVIPSLVRSVSGCNTLVRRGLGCCGIGTSLVTFATKRSAVRFVSRANKLQNRRSADARPSVPRTPIEGDAPRVKPCDCGIEL